MKVTLIDYGAGNLTSVERAFHRLGVNSIRATTPHCIADAGALVLPGVGHFAALVRGVDERALRAPLVDALHRGVPFLGICLGLQALYESSEEAPELRGLGLLCGTIRMLPSQVKLPHMGWNQVSAKGTSRLLEGIDTNAYFYFAHSYAAIAASEDRYTAATSRHGSHFTAVVEKQNICAVQFHPEKSAAAGTRVLQNFLRLGA